MFLVLKMFFEWFVLEIEKSKFLLVLSWGKCIFVHLIFFWKFFKAVKHQYLTSFYKHILTIFQKLFFSNYKWHLISFWNSWWFFNPQEKTCSIIKENILTLMMIHDLIINTYLFFYKSIHCIVMVFFY